MYINSIISDIFSKAQEGSTNTYVVGFLTTAQKNIIINKYNFKIKPVGYSYNIIIFDDKKT